MFKTLQPTISTNGRGLEKTHQSPLLHPTLIQKKLYSEKVYENVIKVLVVHEKEFTMKHYGGDPFSPERLLEEISKVSYSGINWKGLKI